MRLVSSAGESPKPTLRSFTVLGSTPASSRIVRR